jgi:transposase
MTKEDRQHQAERLYKSGLTQQAIAHMLGVSQSTIRDDLRGLVVTTKPPRPKGGRPKGGGRSRSSKRPNEVQRQASINVKPDHWETCDI